jgi:uncharacterized protein YegJ (DUF2314 family)
MTLLLSSPTVAEQHGLRDVYVRDVRGDLWDWLFIWKGRMTYGLVINALLEEWQKLDEAERRRIILTYQRPDE